MEQMSEDEPESKDYSFRPPMLTQLVHIKNKKTGLIEVIDVRSEEVVAVQDEHGGPYREASGIPSLYIYNHSTADLVCQMIIEGAGLSEISRKSEMPSMATIDLWRKNHPEFMQKIINAYHMRAEYRADKAMQEIENMTDKASATVAEKRANLYFRGAGYDNPARFSAKSDNSGGGGTTIVVNTGIIREEKNVGDNECQVIQEKNMVPKDPSPKQNPKNLNQKENLKPKSK